MVLSLVGARKHQRIRPHPWMATARSGGGSRGVSADSTTMVATRSAACRGKGADTMETRRGEKEEGTPATAGTGDGGVP